MQMVTIEDLQTGCLPNLIFHDHYLYCSMECINVAQTDLGIHGLAFLHLELQIPNHANDSKLIH